MTATSFPVTPAAVVDATKASSPVAAVVAAMRRIDPAGGPVAAHQVRVWADTLMAELYSARVVRWEYQNKNDFAPGCWVNATAEHVYDAQKRGCVVRALFETLRVIQPEHYHAFKDGACTKCGDPQDWSGPDCEPLVKAVDPRTRFPMNPAGWSSP